MKLSGLVFMGTADIAAPALEAVCGAGYSVKAVVTQPDRPAGRGRRVLRCPVARCAEKLGLEILQPHKIAQARQELAGLGADAACVMAYGQVLPQPVLEAFPLGCVNAHTSLLPRLRGAAPINHAIISGLDVTGVTTMFMDKGLDTGDILLQEKTAISAQETAGSLAGRLAEMSAALLLRTLEQMTAGRLPRTPQDQAKATYAPTFKKTDGLLDWRRSAAELDRLVRGMDPWPSAHTFLGGRLVKLYAPTQVRQWEHKSAPGVILPAPPDSPGLLWVAAGEGALGVGQVQAAGKKRMSAKDFLRGARLADGAGFQSK